jgi:hypothetical protein
MREDYVIKKIKINDDLLALLIEDYNLLEHSFELLTSENILWS